MSVRSFAPAAIAAGVLVIGALYFFFDPADYLWAPKCVFHSVTGWDCPGCGSQRMIHALLHADFAAAWKANAFFLIASPVLALMAVAACFRTRLPRLYRFVNSLPVIISICSAIVIWTIARNLVTIP